MSTARRKTSDAAATPPKPAVKSSPATRSTVPRKAKAATVAGDAAELTKAAATKPRTSSKTAGSKVAQAGPVEPSAERAEMIVDRETMIRERAYLRYLQRGGGGGGGEAMTDWLAAEREIDAELPQRGEPA